MIVENGFHFPSWWNWTRIDWDYLSSHMQRINLLRIRAFKLANDPTCNIPLPIFDNDEGLVESHIMCDQYAGPGSNYNDHIECVDCNFKDDMYEVATSIFEAVNYLRTQYITCSSLFTEIWAVRQCQKQF